MKKLLTEKKLAVDSVDTQIDALIVDFERKALKNKSIGSDDEVKGAPPGSELTEPEGREEEEEPEGAAAPKTAKESRVEFDIKNILSENIKFILGEADKEKNDKKNADDMRLRLNINAPEIPDRKPENLDIDTFVANVARLMSHANDLLSVPKVVLARAMKFLEEKYDEDTRNMAEMSIRTNYDVDVEAEDVEKKPEIEREY